MLTKQGIVKRLLVFQYIVISLIFFGQPVHAKESVLYTLNTSQQEAYTELQRDSSNLSIQWDDLYSIPNWIKMTNVKLPSASADLSERTYQFLEQYKSLYKMSDPRTEFTVAAVVKDDLGMTHITLQQRYQKVDVYAARLQFHFTADNKLVSINGSYLPGISLDNVPKVSRTQAKQLVNKNLQKSLQLNDEQLNQLDIQSGSEDLFIYNDGLFSGQKADTYFVWRISTYSRKADVSKLYYLNAIDGSVIKQLDNSPEVERRATYVLSDCWDSVGTLAYDEAGLEGTYDEQAETVDQYSNQIYDYYNNNFGRDSYDDDGSTIESYTHYSEQTAFYPLCSAYNGATWDPDLRVIRYGEDFLSLDVAGHELTHGVIQYVVGNTPSDTLEYVNESGALNESYADIFGEMIEFYSGGGDWMLGTDLLSGPIRDFADPNRAAYNRTLSYDSATNYGRATHVDEKAISTDLICAEEVDSGCIHFNSGITNNAFYLTVEGGANIYSGETVIGGVPREAAEQIYYRALTTYLDTNSDFSDAYNATMQSCLDLNDSDSTTYPFSYCETVFDAFAAVGINTDSSYAWANISASSTSGTAPLTITFDGADSIALNSTITNYDWDFGDGSTDSGGAVSYTYTNPGTYTATLTLTDSTGYTNDDSTTITVYASGTISTDTTWSVEYSPYVISGGLTVASGYTLTIEPGVVVKFLSSSDTFTVYGTLNAIGTAASPIIFTSYKDDDYGGDTNGDENATTPAAGDWYYFRIADSIATANLDYVTIQYGGYTGFSSVYPMFLIDNNVANVTVDHSTIQYSQRITMQIDTGSTSTIQNSTIINSASLYAIYFTGGTSTITNNNISATSGYGVYVNKASPILTNNTFTGSGTGVFITGSSSAPTITGNTFTGITYGIYVSSLSSTLSTIITNNTFTNNYYPIQLGSLTATTTMTGNTGSDNAYNVIMLAGSTTGDFTLNMDNDLLYSFSGLSVSSGTTLTIDPGTVIKSVNSSSYLRVNGSLEAQGTLSDPIIFTSYKDDDYGGDTNQNGTADSPAAGDWGYIKASSNSTITFDYLTMRYGGSGSGNWCMFWVDDNATSVSIDHGLIYESKYTTIRIGSGSTITISNSTINNSATGSYYAILDSGGVTTLADNIISSTSGTAVRISSGAPIITRNVVTAAVIGIYIAGSTTTPNISSNIINVISGYGVYVNNASPTLTNNTFTGSSVGLNVFGTSSAPTITGNTFTGNTYGLFVYSLSPTITNNTFTGNTYPIQLGSLTTTTTMTGNTGSGNAYNVIVLAGSTTGDFTLNMDNDLLYAFSSFTVSSGNTLTIDPGVVIKFLDTSSYFTVNGTLSAAGTTTDPIVFTSIKDDINGGDTNNDGSATSPAAGDWKSITIASGGTATLNYATMQYGGYYPNAMFLIDDNAAGVTVDNSTFQYSTYYTMQIDPGSTNTIQNSTISNAAGNYGAYITGGTSTITNTIFSAVNGDAVYVNNASPTLTSNIFTGSGSGLNVSGYSATPTVTGNTFTGNMYGIYISGSASPIFTNNLIYDNASYGLLNEDSAITITAENNWWGDASGPYNATTNPTGTGDWTSDYVDFDPWLIADPTIDITPPADATLGTVSKDAWTPSLTVNWTNPSDSDFDHIQIDRTNVTAGTTTTLSSTETGTSYIDTTPSFNIMYSYTLYACDTSSNCSSGVTTSSNRLRNPAPTGLTLTAGDKSITVKASSAASHLGGYIIYYGTTRATMTNTLDVGNVTTNTITGLTNGTRYYVAVSAYSTSFVESARTAIKNTVPHH